MLVLNRNTGESVRIRDISSGTLIAEVRVMRVAGDRVRLGFEATPNLRIDRSEIDDRRRRDAARDTARNAG